MTQKNEPVTTLFTLSNGLAWLRMESGGMSWNPVVSRGSPTIPIILLRLGRREVTVATITNGMASLSLDQTAEICYKFPSLFRLFSFYSFYSFFRWLSFLFSLFSFVSFLFLLLSIYWTIWIDVVTGFDARQLLTAARVPSARSRIFGPSASCLTIGQDIARNDRIAATLSRHLVPSSSYLIYFWFDSRRPDENEFTSSTNRHAPHPSDCRVPLLPNKIMILDYVWRFSFSLAFLVLPFFYSNCIMMNSSLLLLLFLV